jgi:quinoprotein dehydrogenase-associated probable ABC transporter substrate-binding protein
MTLTRLVGRIGLVFALCVAVFGASIAASDDERPPRKSFKVCADPNSMPASNQKQEGFENKIAKIFADSLGLPLEFYWFPQRFKFFRNSLKKENPDGSYNCDLVMSVPVGLDMAATTKPYYHSTWAMVYVKGRGLDDIKTQDDLVNLSPERKKQLRIGLYDVGPATDWAFKHDLIDYMVSYQHMTADVDDYPGRIIENDLVQDKINVTFEWGPIAGYYAKKIKDHELVVIPMVSEPGAKFDYTFAMAVRFGDKEWKQTINDLIDKHRDDINKVFTDYGVPLLEVNAADKGSSEADDNKGKAKDNDVTEKSKESGGEGDKKGEDKK